MTEARCSRCGHEPLHGRCSGCGHWLCVLCPTLNRRDDGKLRTCDEPHACGPCRKRLAEIVVGIGADWPLLPLALTRSSGSGERVSGGATHPSLPFTVDAWDLLHTPHRAVDALPSPVDVAEQVGWLPVPVVLGGWVDDWACVRDLGETGPVADVLAQVRWLSDRVEWACDHHPAVDDFASEVSTLARIVHALGPGSAERHEACDGKGCDDCHGRGAVPVAAAQRMPGQPCPRCHYTALTRRHDGEVRCEHPDCGTIWREAEYEHITRAAAAGLRRSKTKEAA